MTSSLHDASSYIEVQCDGLIGCTHNYAGLSFGNVASEKNAQALAYPRQAALQGLEKMRFVHRLGLAQVILPPPLRPNLALLEACGISLDHPPAPEDAFASGVVRAAWSASTMWSANAAMVSPAPDTNDGALHLCTANLASSLHRSQEAAERYAVLSHIFGGVAQVHPALPACLTLSDEGAANHMRLSPGHGAPGVEIFVYGRGDTKGIAPKRYPARQSMQSCEAIARLHHLPPERVVLALQHPDAIDAGVFHNDVIAMSNEAVMIYHELTFHDEAGVLEELARKAAFPLTLIRITQAELPIEDAVTSYFYNSQLLSLPSGGMAIVAPTETEHNPRAHAAMQRIVEDPSNSVQAVHYLDVRESMRNGGGPACLRLRVVMPREALAKLPQAFVFSEERYETLRTYIEAHYPESLAPSQLCDAALAREMHQVHAGLMRLFER